MSAARMYGYGTANLGYNATVPRFAPGSGSKLPPSCCQTGAATNRVPSDEDIVVEICRDEMVWPIRMTVTASFDFQ